MSAQTTPLLKIIGKKIHEAGAFAGGFNAICPSLNQRVSVGAPQPGSGEPNPSKKAALPLGPHVSRNATVNGAESSCVPGRVPAPSITAMPEYRHSVARSFSDWPYNPTAPPLLGG